MIPSSARTARSAPGLVLLVLSIAALGVWASLGGRTTARRVTEREVSPSLSLPAGAPAGELPPAESVRSSSSASLACGTHEDRPVGVASEAPESVAAAFAADPVRRPSRPSHLSAFLLALHLDPGAE